MTEVEERHSALELAISRTLAVLMPLLELGAIGYATYVVIYLLCVSYLMKPAPHLEANDIHPRVATGIALIVLYVVLLLPLLIAFMRLLQVQRTDPGFVPLGDPSLEKQSASTKGFDRYDAYVCDPKGWPIWCPKCHNWKPDRTHHDSQTGRCVRRMDHFCPWAGGIISETTYKFFMQFLFYGFLFTGYLLVVVAYFLAERIRLMHPHPTQWIVVLALASLFFLFTFGMFVTTFYNLSLNYTTVEAYKRGETLHIAMLRRIFPSDTDLSMTNPNGVCEVARDPSRPYIVVQIKPFDNPWDCGTRENLKSIMGASILDWLLPLKMSPCTNHTDTLGEFKWGPIVAEIMGEHPPRSQHA